MVNDDLTIQTLDEILANMDKSAFAKNSTQSKHTHNSIVPTSKHHHSPDHKPKPLIKTTASYGSNFDNQKNTHQNSLDITHKNTNPTSINPNKSTPQTLDNIQNPTLVQLLQNTPQESLATTDRQTNYLRWLAFYYLSKREHSKYELKAKLLAKGCESFAVDELLTEFAQKDYQSDLRTALMIVKEAMRLGRGRRYIEQKLWQYKPDVPYSLDELSEMANDSLSDDILKRKDTGTQTTNWLKLAVHARCKKYGDNIPANPQEKARQLRFLQYRGFEMDVCFDALKMSLKDFDF